MNKIKARKPRKIKGGIKSDIVGPLLPQSLYKYANAEPNNEKIKKLQDIYTTNYKQLQDNLNSYEKQFELVRNASRDENKKDLDLNNLNYKKDIAYKKIYGNVAKYSLNGIANIVAATATLGKYMIENGKFMFNQFTHGGQGIFLKIFGILLLIILIVVGISFTGIFSKDITSVVGGNDIISNIVNTDYDNYIPSHNSFSFLKKMSDGFNNIIPSNLKYNFGSMANSISYITTGKNQYESLLINREELKEGRSDNIFHINFKNNIANYQNSKTYCTLKPKDIIFNFNQNLQPNSDYNKLDSDLVNNIKYPNKYTVPINPSESGRFILDIKNAKYGMDDDSTLDASINAISSKIKPLFKTNKNNEITFNIVDTYKTNTITTGIIALYGTILLNKNYKGPIMIIKSSGTSPNKLYYSIYYINGKYKYYNTSNILNDFTFSLEYYHIDTLFDQSGNNNHFRWRESDMKYAPYLYKQVDLTKQYEITFESRNILYLDNPISNPKITVKAKIKVTKKLDDLAKTNDYAKISSYMDFLASNSKSMIKLNFDGTKNEDNNIPDKYIIEPSNPNNQKEYLTDTIEYIIADIDNANIETLGMVDDPRPRFESGPLKGELKEVDINGKKLFNEIIAHNFIGKFYELYIYDRTKMI